MPDRKLSEITAIGSATNDALLYVVVGGASYRISKANLFAGLAATTDLPTNITELTNDAGYITDYTVTEGDVTAHQAALSVTKAQISDFVEADYATSAEGDLAVTALQPGDDVSELTNDAGYITGYTVTEGDVTAHQAALSVTKSQISDFVEADYATGAEGDLAATALQPSDIASGTITPATGDIDFNNLGGTFTLDGVEYSDLAAGSNVTIVDDGDGTATINVAAGTATIGDGSYGDVVVSGTGTVWTVTEAGVTQHQAALSVTKSQISDFVEADYATGAEGDLATTAVQPGDNVSVLTNNAGYITGYTVTEGDVTAHQAALSVTKSQISDFVEADYATGAEGDLAATAMQPGGDAARLGSGAATDGYVLTADGAGGAAWEAVSGGGATLTLDGVTYTDLAAGSNVTIVNDGDGTATINVSSGSATVGDGNYGDVIVSGTGTVWTVTETGVTQHQAALSVTKSQISDFVEADYATGAEGDLAATAVQPGDNVSVLTNNAGYITDYTVTEGDVTAHQAALSVTKSQISDFVEADYATGAEGDLAATAVQPGDNVSVLTNNAGYITDYTVTEGDVTAHQAALSVTKSQISDFVEADYATGAEGDLAATAVQPGDNVSVLTNNAGYITGYTVTEGDVTAHQAALSVTKSQISDFVEADYATGAEGDLATTALQPGDDASTLGSGAATDGYVLKANGGGGTVWAAESAGGAGVAYLYGGGYERALTPVAFTEATTTEQTIGTQPNQHFRYRLVVEVTNADADGLATLSFENPDGSAWAPEWTTGAPDLGTAGVYYSAAYYANTGSETVLATMALNGSADAFAFTVTMLIQEPPTALLEHPTSSTAGAVALDSTYRRADIVLTGDITALTFTGQNTIELAVDFGATPYSITPGTGARWADSAPSERYALLVAAYHPALAEYVIHVSSEAAS